MLSMYQTSKPIDSYKTSKKAIYFWTKLLNTGTKTKLLNTGTKTRQQRKLFREKSVHKRNRAHLELNLAVSLVGNLWRLDKSGHSMNTDQTTNWKLPNLKIIERRTSSAIQTSCLQELVVKVVHYTTSLFSDSKQNRDTNSDR